MDIKFAWVASEMKHAYILTVLGVFTRTALAWHVGFSIKQHTVKKVWEAVIENHLQPNDTLKKGISIEVRNDNDPRFSAKMVQEFFLKIISIRCLLNHINLNKMDILSLFTLF